MRTNEYFFLTESDIFELPNKEDVKFLKEFREYGQPLIEESRNRYKINFVGEVITPNYVYFSMPKNMDYTEENVHLIKRVLVKYSKDREGKRLVTSRGGSYTSERSYFDKLKSYYLDYITYEFIYPQKKKIIHQNTVIDGAKISIIDTIKNRKRYGTGVTFKVKDIKNSDDWLLDDIYYYTLMDLVSILKISDYEISEIGSMTKYLLGEGYSFNKIKDNKVISNSTNKVILDMLDVSKVVEVIKNTEVGAIHNPIKNTLLEYYENKKKSSTIKSINVIFTRNFEKVWEIILQDALENEKSDGFRKEMKPLFTNIVTYESFIPNSQVELNLLEYPLVEEDNGLRDKWMVKRGDRYFICERGRSLIPDIFVELNDGRRFLGDAKYYKDPISPDYEKEFGSYNDAQNNLYPMIIFSIPPRNIDRTTVPRQGFRTTGDKEILIIVVCVKDVIIDAIFNKGKVLKKSVNLISKYSRRW
jgi:hypothetical protein